MDKSNLTHTGARLLWIAAACSFFGCSGNNRKIEIALRIKNKQCVYMMERNVANIEQLFQELTHHSIDRFSDMKKNCLLIDSMRVKYNSSSIRKDLLNYADTVMNHYDKVDSKDSSIVSDWSSLRQDILNADSSAILDFYYLTLTAEHDLLNSYFIEQGP